MDDLVEGRHGCGNSAEERDDSCDPHLVFGIDGWLTGRWTRVTSVKLKLYRVTVVQRLDKSERAY